MSDTDAPVATSCHQSIKLSPRLVFHVCLPLIGLHLYMLLKLLCIDVIHSFRSTVSFWVVIRIFRSVLASAATHFCQMALFTSYGADTTDYPWSLHRYRTIIHRD